MTLGLGYRTGSRRPPISTNFWDATREEALKDRLYRQIGQLQVELDWLKKKVGQDG